MKKKIFFVIVFLFLTMIFAITTINHTFAKKLTIDEILETDSYNSLSEKAKSFVRDYYEESGIVLLTESLAKAGDIYLNPSYIEYLDSEKKDEYNVIPTAISYIPNIKKASIKSNGSTTYAAENLPSNFDLRNVNGKNYTTPNKNQLGEGLCWAYATVSLLETHDLIAKDKSYDSTATLFSEKQLDYALSSNGIVGGNNIINFSRELADGTHITNATELLLQRLAGYTNEWNSQNASIISNNAPLAPQIVFDRSKALYEAEELIDMSNINYDLSNTELNESLRNEIKLLAYNNGGAIVNISMTATFKNALGDYDEYIAVPSVDNRYGVFGTEQHAMHLIGWNDNYEYTYCHVVKNNKISDVAAVVNTSTGEISCNDPGENATVTRVTKKGAWIVKNSWGESEKYIYLSYDGLIDDIHFIKSYAIEKTWDNIITLKKDNDKYIIDNNVINNEIVDKLKILSTSAINFELYFSEDGSENNLELLGNYTSEYAGAITIDLSDKNININKNSYFVIRNAYASKVFLFTKNSDDELRGYTTDFIYNIDTETPNKNESVSIFVKTNLRNVDDAELVNYKIKNPSNEYLPTNGYTVSNSYAYCDMAIPVIDIKGDYAQKGIYLLETWKGNQLLYTSSINLIVDYLGINGDGSQDNPWQIENVRHLNMMRNAPADNYILMNDLDFEYDTQNVNGLFYNDGDGWNSLDDFVGNFDGNNKIIKNMYTTSGLFDNIYVNYNDCKYTKCGVYNLHVDNMTYNIKGAKNVGSVINRISIYETNKYIFNNLLVTNLSYIFDESQNVKQNEELPPHINMEMSYTNIAIGGIVGLVFIQQSTVNFDDMYSSFNFNGISYDNVLTENYIGGIVGSVNIARSAHFSINNSKVYSSYNINSDNDTNYYISDIAGYYKGDSNGSTDFYINNTIGIIDSIDNSRVNTNAFVGYNYKNSTGTIVNGSKSTLNYTENDKISTTNIETNLKPYELAHATYDGSYYIVGKNIRYEPSEFTEEVRFEDKFNILGNLIPTLKIYPDEYSKFYKTYTINVGERENINNLVSENHHHYKLSLNNSFDCDFDVCENSTDETIVGFQKFEDENFFTGLKPGTTKAILYDEVSGYLDTVTITVSNKVNKPSAEEYCIKGLKYNGTNQTITNAAKNGFSFSNNVKKNAGEYTVSAILNDGYVWSDDTTENITFNCSIGKTSLTVTANDVTIYYGESIPMFNKTITGFVNNETESVLTGSLTYTIKKGNNVITLSNTTAIGNYDIVPSGLTSNNYSINYVNGILTIIKREFIVFDANGGVGEMMYIDAAATVNLPTCAYKKDKYEFKGWSKTKNGAVIYSNGQKNITDLREESTLYAIWQANNSITIDLNDNDYKNRVVERLTLNDFINGLGLQENYTVEVQKRNGDVLGNTDKVGTGSKTIIFKDNKVYSTKINIIKGDVTGDGIVNIADVRKTADYSLSGTGLDYYDIYAAEVTKNNTINIADVRRIADYSLNTEIDLWN